MKQKITLWLERELIHKTKVMAASQDRSVTRFLSEKLEEIVREADVYEHAKQVAFADLDQGFHLGGVLVRREGLHQR